MIANIEKDEKEKNENENINKIINHNNNLIDNNLSIQNFYGEEEDEDDLLKSDTESNNSFKSIHGIIDINKDPGPFSKLNDKIPIIGKNDIKNLNDSLNPINEQNLEKKNEDEENKEKKDENNDNKSSLSDLFKSLESKEIKKHKKVDTSDESEELEDEENEEEEENESDSINPYNKYINSELVYKNFLDKIIKGNYLYDKNKNKYYIYINCLYGKKGNYVCLNYEFNN